MKYRGTATLMKGNRVFEYAINDVSENLMKFKDELNLTDDSVDAYVFHQAQKLILDNIADVCGLPEEKVPTSYEEYGNTSGASVPITICHNRDKYLNKDKVNICSCGFGVGLSMGISYYQIDPKCILPIIETDAHDDTHIKHSWGLYSRRALLMNPNTEIGKLVARQMDRASCNLSLYGDKDTLEELRSQFFWKDCDLFVDDLEKAAEDSSKKYHAVIYDMENHSEEQIREQVGFLKEQGMLIESSNVILVTKEMEHEDALRDFMQSIAEEYGCRANAVAYVPESLDLFPDIGDSTDWADRQIHSEEPENMARPFFLTNAIANLVSLDLAAVSQTVIHISGSIKKFN